MFGWSFQYKMLSSYLASATVLSVKARVLRVDDRIGQWMKNFGHGMVLGVMADATIGLMSTKDPFNLSRSFAFYLLIPAALAMTTSGISYLARKRNYHADQLEALDKNIGKWMDIVAIISSIAGTILLASRASKAPLNFAFTAAISGINVIHAYLYYNSVQNVSDIPPSHDILFDDTLSNDITSEVI